MFCKGYTRAGTHTNGKPQIIADIIVKTAPTTKPITTDGVKNVEQGLMLAPGSSLMSTNPFGFYTLNDEYTWDEL